MILPEKHNFNIWKGATFRTKLTLYTDAGQTVRDLSGYSGELVIRDKPEGAALLTLNTNNGGIILGDEAGTIELIISAEDTADIAWQTAVYDLTITAGSGGDTDALLFGGFTAQGV